MRGWVSAVANYSQPVPLGAVMRSLDAGTVIESRHPDWRVGERVTGTGGYGASDLMRVADLDHMELRVKVNENDIVNVKPGNHAVLTIDAFPGRKFPGHVRRVAPYVLDREKQARTVEIEAEFENPEGTGLLTGYSADVEIVLQGREGVLRIPAPALMPGGRVLVLEFSRIWAPLGRAYDWYSFNVLPWLGSKVAGDAASYRYLAESIRMHPDQKSLQLLMEQAGLEDVEYFNLAAGAVALHRGFKY